MSWLSPQIEHFYPENVHILDDPLLNHLCAISSQEQCIQPQFNRNVKKIFEIILSHLLNSQWPQTLKTLSTRMTAAHPNIKLESTLFDQTQKAVCVDIARAGMLPAQIFFDTLNELVDPNGLRLDHVFASRVTNEKEEVTHTELNSSKVGGDVDEAFLLLPDPMGATGSSLCEVIDFYKKNIKGNPKKIISAHMIVTPEFIKKVTDSHPDVIIYAARLDRGLSQPYILNETPGKYWEEEKGLNDRQYIVPGAGGVGELINNSFV